MLSARPGAKRVTKAHKRGPDSQEGDQDPQIKGFCLTGREPKFAKRRNRFMGDGTQFHRRKHLDPQERGPRLI